MIFAVQKEFLHCACHWCVLAWVGRVTGYPCFRLTFVLKVEAKIAEELRQQGLLATPEEPRPRAPNYADLGKLAYLSCVIKEAMRVHTVSFCLAAVLAAWTHDATCCIHP